MRTRHRVAALLKRDGSNCWLCGQHLDLAQKHPHPRSPTIDHVLERRNGGSNEMSNLKLAHAECNMNRDAWYPHTAGPLPRVSQPKTIVPKPQPTGVIVPRRVISNDAPANVSIWAADDPIWELAFKRTKS